MTSWGLLPYGISRSRPSSSCSILPAIGISPGRTLSITPTSSSAAMPRLASARLMERPAAVAVDCFLGSRRRSRRVTRYPRRARKIASSDPARPAPTSVISGVSRGDLTACASAHSSQGAPKNLDEAVDLLVTVVEGDGSHPDHVGLAPVAGDAGCFEFFENGSSRSGRLHLQRELTSPPTRISRGEDLDRIARFPRKQPFEVAREAERFLPQRLHPPRFQENVERSSNGCEREDRRIRELPDLRAGDRSKAGLHPEARLLVVPPPSGQARQTRPHAVPLVDEAGAHRARPRVQVLVRAPHGEVHVPLVEGEDQVSRRVSHVETDDATLRVRESRDRFDLECLARVVLNSRKEDQGDRLA